MRYFHDNPHVKAKLASTVAQLPLNHPMMRALWVMAENSLYAHNYPRQFASFVAVVRGLHSKYSLGQCASIAYDYLCTDDAAYNLIIFDALTLFAAVVPMIIDDYELQLSPMGQLAA